MTPAEGALAVAGGTNSKEAAAAATPDAGAADLDFACTQSQDIHNVLSRAMITKELPTLTTLLKGMPDLLSHVVSAFCTVCHCRLLAAKYSPPFVAVQLLHHGISRCQGGMSAIVVQITVALLLSIPLDKDLVRVREIMRGFSAEFSRACETAESPESNGNAALPFSGVALLPEDIIAFVLDYVCTRRKSPTLSGVDALQATLREVESDLSSRPPPHGYHPWKSISAGIEEILKFSGDSKNNYQTFASRPEEMCSEKGYGAWRTAAHVRDDSSNHRGLFHALGMIVLSKVMTNLPPVLMMQPWF